MTESSGDGSLDSMIERLVEVDHHRDRAIKLRQDALDRLPLDWEPIQTQNVVEVATVASALHLAKRKGLVAPRAPLCEQLSQYLCDLELAHILPERLTDDVPLLRAARVLTALVLRPGHCFSRAALICYYRILRELYTPNPPDFVVGGIQVSEGEHSTAFLTGECVTAIGLLAKALERTAEFFARIDAWYKIRDGAAASLIPQSWRDHEELRARETLLVDFARARRYLIFDYRELEHVLSKKAVTGKCVCEALLTGFKGAVDQFDEAISECNRERMREEQEHPAPHRYRTESGHLLAKEMLQKAKTRLQMLLEVVTKCRWGEAASIIRDEASKIRKVLRPAEHYLQGVLDRELANAAAGRANECDHPELAFAASAYGRLQGKWDDPRLKTAATLLASALSTKGLFPVGRPIRTNYHGYRLEVIGAEVLRAMAELLRHVKLPLMPEVSERMLRLFEDTMMIDGLAYEQMSRKQSAPWTTALAVAALHGIVRMLDEVIRREVFRHFQVRYPSPDITLDNMFYSDAGAQRDGVSALSVCLQTMRAHVLGVESAREAVWSVVLHGPPGTGKTTIAEALAASANLPLVEVTPSDLVVGGADMVERRARHVFLALTMLTDAVILFDEFDSVLRRRTSKETLNVFQFLTPGMLPKLKGLHDQCKKRRVAYLLATNFVASLDEAAVRKGRFDQRVGVYPPNLVARSGRLLSELFKYAPDALKDDAKLERIAQVLDLTGGGSMPTLGRIGWFTAPSLNKAKEGTPFYFICSDGKAPERVVPEALCPKEFDDKLDLNVEEWREWRQVDTWDEQLHADAQWASLRALFDAPPPLPVKPARPSVAPSSRTAHTMIDVKATSSGSPPSIDQLGPDTMRRPL